MACGESLPAAVSLRDLGKVRLKDLSTPEHVYQVVHPQLRQEFPALRSLEATPNNLPQQATSFIGREKELAELQRLLARARLLTLTGSGGCGKTRLGLQVAADSLERFPDGAWLVELAPLADPGLVPQTVATVLGLKEEPGKPISQTLIEHLKDKRLLLLLDNCEHLLDGCAQAGRHARASMPAACDSREQPGSARHRRRAGVPRAVAVAARSEAGAYAGLRRAIRGGAAVHRPCPARPPGLSGHRPERLPRSLPSVIGWTGFRWPSSWRRRGCARFRSRRSIGKLDQRFRLLTGGSRTALPRQQTLRSLIDWSYDLLNDPEKLLLQRLSVFAGGWTLEAAEQVCAGDGVDDAGGPRSPDFARRQEPGGGGAERRALSLPAAGDGAAVCPREAAGERGRRGGSGTASGLLPGAGGGGGIRN